MLENAHKTRKQSKEEFRREIEPLKTKLSNLQHQIKDQKKSVIIVFEGWSAAGKGSLLSDVILTLDPRNFKVRCTIAPTEEEKRKPPLWRHWNNLPERGIIGLYDKSWYRELWANAFEKEANEPDLKKKLHALQVFERQMTDDGTIILKFFIHISQKEQKTRLNKLASKKSTSWRAKPHHYHQNKHYDEFYRFYEETIEKTNSKEAPWHIICGQNRRSALSSIYRILVEQLDIAVNTPHCSSTPLTSETLRGGNFTLLQMPTLSEVSLEQKMLKEDAYKQALRERKKHLEKLHNLLYMKKIPVVIAYEGWDAAGKGGNIRRLTSALDPRGYEVIPIASPTPVEKAHQHLWRFWHHLPKDGHITLFDRTWYGRVMVERVEGFATETEWRRAYREINEFEAQLHDWGAIVLKFWLHISKEEQLRRFEARQNTPEKRWKITDEDWRNREKWDAYETAINDMLRLTSTDFAPWTIIESEDKRYARIKAIDTFIRAIEERL